MISNLKNLKKGDIFGILLWILVPLTMFTIAKTKIRWYILPIYSAFSILLGALAGRVLQTGNRMTKTILAAAILFVSVFYETSIVSYLNHPAHWSQSDVLSAELADDLHVENGGLKQFLQKNKALLLIPKKEYSRLFIDSHDLKVITYNKWGYIAEKRLS